MIIDTTKFREANKKMKDKVIAEHGWLTNEAYTTHIVTLKTLDGILDIIEESQKDTNDIDNLKYFIDRHFDTIGAKCRRISLSDVLHCIDDVGTDLDTNPEHYESHEKFMKFMDDPDIANFGKWMMANGEAMMLLNIECAVKMIPSIDFKEELHPELQNTEL